MKRAKQLIAILLTLLMLLSVVPVQVFAESVQSGYAASAGEPEQEATDEVQPEENAESVTQQKEADEPAFVGPVPEQTDEHLNSLERFRAQLQESLARLKSGERKSSPSRTRKAPRKAPANASIEFDFNEGTKTLTFTGTGAMDDYGEDLMGCGDDHKFDKSLLPPWQSVAEQAETIVIGEGITAIGSCSFMLLDNLKTVVLPSTLESIGEAAFAFDGALETADLPAGLTSIGQFAFFGAALRRVVVPAGVETLPLYAFGCCLYLEEVVLSEGLRSMEDAFAYAIVPELRIPSSLEIFTENLMLVNQVYVFSKTVVLSLNSGLSFGTDPMAIDAIRFYLKRFIVNQMLAQLLGDVEAVDYEEAQEELLVYMNQKYDLNLESTNDLYSAFFNFTDPIYYCYDDSAEHEALQSAGGKHYLIAADGSFSETLCPDCLMGQAGENITWRFDDVTKTLIFEGYGAMYDRYNSSPWRTFSGETLALEFITTPEQPITSIRYEAFSGFSKLQTVTLPEGLQTIGSYAFEDCVSLEHVSLPSTLSSLSDAFSGCDRLTEIIVASGNAYYTVKNRCLYGRQESGLILVWCPADLEELTLVAEAYHLSYSLTNLKHLSSVAVEDGNAYFFVDDGCLYGPYSYHTYYSSKELLFCPKTKTELIIPAGITGISGGLNGCTVLETLTLGKDMSSFGGDDLEDCLNLNTIYVDPENTSFCEDDGLIYNAGKTTVLFCPKDKASVTLPETLRTIGYYAFSHCAALTLLTIPKTVEYVYRYAFSGCSLLTELDFPAATSYIDYKAFQGCTSLESITFRNPKIGFDRDEDRPFPNGAIIYAYEGSKAQTAADRGGNPFVALAVVRTAELVSLPYSTTYYEDDTYLNQSGLTVQVEYDDGSVITYDGYSNNLKISGFVPGQLGTQTITVSVGQTNLPFEINVIEIPVLTLGTPATFTNDTDNRGTFKFKYTAEQDALLRLVYYIYDGSYSPITVQWKTVNGTDSRYLNSNDLLDVSAGVTYYFSISAYSSGTQSLTLNDGRIVNATLVSPPNQTTYYEDETSLNQSGLSVQVEFGDGSEVTYSGSSSNLKVSGFVPGQLGTQTITVSVGQIDLAYDIEVIEIPALTLGTPATFTNDTDNSRTFRFKYTAEQDASLRFVYEWYGYDDYFDYYFCDDYYHDFYVYWKTVNGTQSRYLNSNDLLNVSAGVTYYFSMYTYDHGDYSLTLSDVRIVDATLVSSPNQTTYYEDDTSLNQSGLWVQVEFNDGSTATYGGSSSNLKVSGFVPGQLGTQTITVTVGQFNLAYDIEVIEIPVLTVGTPATFTNASSYSRCFKFKYTAEQDDSLRLVYMRNGSDCSNGINVQWKTANGNDSRYLYSNDLLNVSAGVTYYFSMYTSDYDNDYYYGDYAFTVSHAHTMGDTVGICAVCGEAIPTLEEGQCGHVAYYTLYEDGTLLIYGTGNTSEYYYNNHPWTENYAERIKRVWYLDQPELAEGMEPWQLVSAGDISSGITDVPSRAFYSCVNLEEVRFSSSIQTIGDNAFFNCNNLKNITLPEMLTTIGDYAFKGCYNLQTVDFGAVETIGNYAFSYCRNLNSVALPETLTTIGDYAFNDCYNLQTVGFGAVETIGNYAFSYCRNLNSVALPETLTTIGDFAFASCNELESIEIPAAVTYIGTRAFGSSSFKAFSVAEGNSAFAAVDGVLYSKNGKILVSYPARKRNNTFAVPSGVETIGAYAFYDCYNLQTVDFGAIETIGDYAFCDCDALTEVTIPNSVTTIGVRAFSSCDALQAVTIQGAPSIGNYAFCDCYNLQTVDFGAVETIGNYAFSYCNNLKNITLLETLTTIGIYAFYNCDALTEVTIPNSVTTIDVRAFSSCDALQAVTIQGAPSIGNYAFCDCYNLQTVDFGAVETIGNYAFNNCDALTEVTIPNNVTYIGSSAFSSCDALQAVTIQGAPSIGEDAFGNCYSLKTLTLNGALSEGYHSFYGSSLERLVLSDTCTSVDLFQFSDSVQEIIVENADCALNGYFDCARPTIYGYEGSTAEAFASGYGCPFVAIEIDHISVKTPPTNTTVYQHESLNTGGLVIEVTYTDGLVLERTDGFTVSGFDKTTVGTQNVTVTFKGKSATFEIEVVETKALQLGQSETAGITYGGEVRFFKFVPEETLSYVYYSTGSYNTYGYLYNSDMSQLYATSYGGSGSNFRISYTLQAGETYFLAARMYYSSTTGTFNVKLECASHNYEWIIDKEPTCGATGLKHQECTRCGAVANSSTVIPATGAHTYDLETISTKTRKSSATCTDPAKYYYTCSVCGSIEKDDTHTFVDGDPLGHSFTSTTYATNDDGTHKIKCTRCDVYGAVVKGVQTVGASEGCSFGNWSTVTPATCEEAGLKQQVCVKCGYAVTAPIDPLGHNFTSTTYATNNDGTHKIKCTRCDVYGAVVKGVQTVGASEGCSLGNWSTVTPATCEEDGVKQCSCVKCGYTQTGSIDKLGHRWNYAEAVFNWDGYSCETATVTCATCKGQMNIDTQVSCMNTPAACETDGSNVYTAVFSVNAVDYTETKTEVLKAPGHDYVAQHEDSVGEEDGYTRYTCSRCQDYYIVLDPAAPVENFIAFGATNAIQLSWLKSVEASVTGYQVFRKQNEEDSFELLTEIPSRDTLFYIDQDVTVGDVYYYAIRAMKADVEGELSETISCVALPDQEAPMITLLLPRNGSTISKTITIEATATDNVVVDRITVFYSDDEGVSWHEIQTVSGTTCSVAFDTTTIADGKVQIKAVAFDRLDNASNGTPIYTYLVDNTGPVQITAFSAQVVYATQLTLSWEKPADKDVAGFVLQQKNGETVTTLSSEIQTLGFNVSGLVPNTSYAFRVAAFDNSGNAGAYTEWLSVTTAADTTAPVISSQSPQPARFNASIPYSVTASDDYGIQKITLQYSVDRVHWADLESKTFTSTNARQTQAFNVNLDDFDEGSLFLRGIAEDVYGNVSASDETAPYVQYIVDRTPPQKPQQVSAVGSDGFITISWEQGNESDLGTYTLYRADSEEGDYEIIAENLSSVNYHDRSVTREQLYYYKLAVYDTAGNLSEMSEPVCAAASADDEAPKVNSISPASDSRIGTANNKISVLFSDNNRLSTAIIEYKTSLFSEYSVLKETANIDNYYQTVEATIPLNDLTDGDKVYIRASCTDTAGHASDKVTASFIVDKKAPSVVDLSVAQTNSSVELGWNDASDADLAGFKVFKRVDDAQFVSIGARKASDTHQYTFTDQLSYGTVQYRVDAVDKVGNISSFYSDALTIEKGSLLQAVIETATYLEAGVQEFFSAENSVSDELVTVYTWDFGDGTFSNDERVVKSYAEPGEYTVTLTIEDVSGQVDSTEKVVSVHERKMLGTANVLVTDENGLPLPYMPVYFDLGESNPQIVYTNASGVASYMMSVGTHSVGFYMDGYLPQAANVDILSGKTTETKLVAQEQDLLTGEFEVHEMDYDEIIAAGIDLDAVDNQQIYKVTVVLTYESKKIPVTYVRNSTSILSVDFGDFGGSSVEPGSSSGSGTDWHPQIQYVPNQSGQEIIAILTIPEVTASYLKQFYSANLYILNNAAESFDIVDCEATIHAPDGLTVVQSTPMKTVIGGGETAYAGWVLRGDQEGTYDLSADFSGILDRFNAPVSVSFQAENPVIVYGADSIQIVVETPEHIFNNLPEDNTSVSGANYKYEPTAYVNIGVKNVSNRDLYNVKLTKPIDPSEPDQTVAIDAEYQSNAGDVSELPKQLTLRDSSKNKTYILDSNGTRTEIPFNSVVTLAPGETLFRYYAVEFNADDVLDWFKDEYAQDLYYELRDCVVKVSDYEGLTYTTVVDNERFYDYYIRTGEPADGNIAFVYGTTDDNKCRKLPVTYSDSFFTQDSRTMNPELAKTTLRLELAGYSSAAYNAAYSHTLSEDNLARATNIMSAYSQMGFSNDKYVGYNTSLTDGSDKAAFSMAMKHIDNGEGSTDTLVALVVRGGGYGAEWASNFNIGTEGNHVGFDGAAQKVYAGLDDYVAQLKENDLIEGNLKLWITGYSRGAATANLTAHALNQNAEIGGVQLLPSNMFVYTFATPRGAIDVDPMVKDDNIFNFISGNDLVPKVAMKQWGFDRYGITYEIPSTATYEEIGSDFKKYANPGATDSVEFKISQHQKFTEDSLTALLATLLFNRQYYYDHLQTSIVEGYKEAYAQYSGDGLVFNILRNVFSGNTEGDFTMVVEIGVILTTLLIGATTLIVQLAKVFGEKTILAKGIGFAVKLIGKALQKAGLFDSEAVSESIDENSIEEYASALVEELIKENGAQDISKSLLKVYAKDYLSAFVEANDEDNSAFKLENFFSGIGSAHYPEYYLALLDHFDETGYDFVGSKMIQVNVDDLNHAEIMVYQGGTLVYKVENGAIAQELVLAEKVKDALLLDLPCFNNQDITIEIVNSSTGGRSFVKPVLKAETGSSDVQTDTAAAPLILLKEFDRAGEYIRTVRFDNAALQKNQTYTLHLSDEVGNADEEFYLESADDRIDCSYDSLNVGEEVHEVTMKNGSATTTTAHENEEFSVVADYRENDAFIEWRSTPDVVFDEKDSEYATVKMPASDVYIQAVYASEKDGVSISVNREGDGTEEGAGTYQILAFAELKAIPAKDNVFVGWFDGDILLSNNPEYRFMVTEEKTITAKYTPSSHIHNYQPVSRIDATCTESGSVTYTCSDCGDSYIETMKPLTHDWSDWTVIADSDSHTRSCQRDGCGETETAAHKWNGGVIITPATCKDAGEVSYTCKVCRTVKTEPIAKLTKHTAGQTVKENVVLSTYTTPGSYDLVVYCTVCGEELSRESKSTPIADHSHRFEEATQEPTCTEEGVKTFTCSLCGEGYTEAIPAVGHIDKNNDGACDLCGMRMSGNDTCKYCGEVHEGFGGFFTKVAHVIAYTIGNIFGEKSNHKHDYKTEVKEATCTEGGCTLSTCTICGKTREKNKTKALGHDWGEWVADKEATCEEEGHRYRVCKRCEEKDEETVSPAHVDQDKDGKCDKCGAAFEKDEGEVCIYCGEVHEGFFKDVVYTFHKLFYKIGGKKK